MPQPQAFIRLRGAIFAENGFNLQVSEIAPSGIRKKSTVYLSTLDTRDKTTNIEPMLGTTGTDDPVFNIPLTPYSRPEKALRMLMLMCACLPAAIAGKRNEKRLLADAWSVMIVSCCGLELRDAKTQIDLISNLYGRGRTLDELNRRGTVVELTKCDPVEMVNEALRL